MAGRLIIVSTDVEFNHYLAKQEGRLVELWYLDSFAELFNQDGENKTNAIGLVHKYVRSITLNHFGTDTLKETLLSQIEEFVNKTLQTWSSLPSVEVKNASAAVSFIVSPSIPFFDSLDDEGVNGIICLLVDWNLNTADDI